MKFGIKHRNRIFDGFKIPFRKWKKGEIILLILSQEIENKEEVFLQLSCEVCKGKQIYNNWTEIFKGETKHRKNSSDLMLEKI